MSIPIFTHLPSSLLLTISHFLPLVELPRLFSVCRRLNAVLNSEEACGFWASWLSSSSVRYTVVASEVTPKTTCMKYACYRMLKTRYCRRVSFLASQRTAIKSKESEIARLYAHTVAEIGEKVCMLILLPSLVLALYLCVFSDSRYWSNVFPSSMIAQRSLTEVKREECVARISNFPFEVRGNTQTGVIYLIISLIFCVLTTLWYLFARGQWWFPSDDILLIYRGELEGAGLHLHVSFLSSPYLSMLLLTPLLAFVDAGLATILMLFPWHTLPPPALQDVLTLVYALEIYFFLRILFQRHKKKSLLRHLFSKGNYNRTFFNGLIYAAGLGCLMLIITCIIYFLIGFGWFVQRLCAQFVNQGSIVWDVASQIERLKKNSTSIESHAFVCAFAPLLMALQWMSVYGVVIVCAVTVRFFVAYRRHKRACEQQIEQNEIDLTINMLTLGLQW